MNPILLVFKKCTPQGFRIWLRDLRRISLYQLQSLIGLKIHKKHYCPISERKFRTFIKSGGLVQSPDSGARERHRFIWHYLKSETPLFTQNPIVLLHISPEHCFYEKLKSRENILYFPVDKFEPGYDYQSLTRNFDLLNQNLETEKYDFIICNHVLEHIPDDATAIENLFKILKTGGNAIVTVPILPGNRPTYENKSITSPKERKKHFVQWDHVRYYGTDISERLEKAGFEVKSVNAQTYFNDSEREKFGLTHESWLFHLSKPRK